MKAELESVGFANLFYRTQTTDKHGGMFVEPEAPKSHTKQKAVPVFTVGGKKFCT
jgi:hypothetical protein